MIYRITKRWTFAAAHHLPTLPEGHKCRRPHGHNWTVTVALEHADLDSDGMVTDYAELGPIGAWITSTLDHRDLNDIDALAATPTAERLAAYIYRTWTTRYPWLVEVTVSETPGTTASYQQ